MPQVGFKCALNVAVVSRCYRIRTIFSHAQTMVKCEGCGEVLCQPTGGKARLVEGCKYRAKTG